MQAHDHLSLKEFQKRADAITNKRLWKRYQIILALQGRTSADIASGPLLFPTPHPVLGTPVQRARSRLAGRESTSRTTATSRLT